MFRFLSVLLSTVLVVDCQYPRSEFGLANIPKIGTFFTGGASSQASLVSVEYNDTWIITGDSNVAPKQGVPYPEAVEDIASASTIINGVNVALFCGGGNDGTYFSSSCYSFDGISYNLVSFPITSCGTFVRNHITNNGLEAPSLASNGSIVYMSGGISVCNSNLNVTQSFQVFKTTDGGLTWLTISSPANISPRSDHSSIVLSSGELLIVGGSNLVNRVKLNDAYKSIDGGLTFTAIIQLTSFTPRSFFSLFEFNSKLFIVGGHDVNEISFPNIWSSPLSSDSWTLACQVPGGLTQAVQAVVDNTPLATYPIIFVGAATSSSTVMSVTLSTQVCGGTAINLPTGSSSFAPPSSCTVGFFSSGSTCVKCSSPSAGQYTVNVCTSTSDTSVTNCSLPTVGQFVSKVCSSGSSSSLGFDTSIQTCSTASPGDTIMSVCEMGSATFAGSNLSLAQTSSPSVGAIVGGILGSFFIIGCFALIYLFLRKKGPFNNYHHKGENNKDDVNKIDSLDDGEVSILIQQTDDDYNINSVSRISKDSNYLNNNSQIISKKNTPILLKKNSSNSRRILSNTNSPPTPNITSNLADDLSGSSYGSASSNRANRLLSKKKTSVNEQIQKRSKIKSPPLSTTFQLKLNNDTDMILTALGDRKNLSSDKRKIAKSQILSIILDGSNENSLNNLILSRLREDNAPQIKTLNDSTKSQLWLPEEGDDSMFLPGASKNIQRNKFFTLIGDMVSEDDEEIMLRGLIKPLNLLPNGDMEGVNAVIFKASIDSSIVVFKSCLPLSEGFGYEAQFSAQEFEYSIPLSLPPHPHIIPILHQFTASSVLVYPWISKDLRDMSNQLKKINGKGFIKRQTTYVVLDYYPSSLRKMKAEKEGKFSEKELMLIALQLFKGVSHLADHEISHRDLKDDNIFVQKDGTLTIADFGCALDCKFRFYVMKEDVGNRLGAPSSIAPEVFNFLKTGPKRSRQEPLWEIFEKNDIFAIGVMLYKLVDISALPSTSNEYSEYEIPQFPSSQFSRAFASLMSSLLAYNPCDRPTAQEAVRKLEMLLFGPKREDRLNKETMERWLAEKRLNLFFNIPIHPDDIFGLDSNLSNIYRSAMLDFFTRVHIEANKIIYDDDNVNDGIFESQIFENEDEYYYDDEY